MLNAKKILKNGKNNCDGVKNFANFQEKFSNFKKKLKKNVGI